MGYTYHGQTRMNLGNLWIFKNGFNSHFRASMLQSTISSIYLIYKALLQRPMIISEALYNIHLCKACRCFIPVWGGATPSQINYLGNIQVTWQLYSACQLMETAHCFCICLSAHMIQYIHTNTLNQVEVWWLGIFQQSTQYRLGTAKILICCFYPQFFTYFKHWIWYK